MAAPTLESYITHMTYGAEGFVMGGVNGLLLATILWDRSLRQRKEMLLIAGLAGADFMFGFGSFLLAAYRITILVLGLQNEAFTARQCAFLPQMFLPHFSMALVSVMNFLVSIDRYLSVAYPLKYHVTNIGFTKKILLLVGLFGIFILLLMFAVMYVGAPTAWNITLLCYSPVWPAWYIAGEYFFIAGVGFLAVVIYVFLFAAFKASIANRAVPTNSNLVAPEESTNHGTNIQVMPVNNPSTTLTPVNQFITTNILQVVPHYGAASNSFSYHERQQHRLTVTLGIINISTLLLYVAPMTVVAFLIYNQISIPTLTPWLTTMTRISPIVNVAVYLYRQNEIRNSMLRLITCNICKTPATNFN